MLTCPTPYCPTPYCPTLPAAQVAALDVTDELRAVDRLTEAIGVD
ncbi:MAG TPA: hypothetical protein VK020_04405 [Microlunatus sp.]|nr:hypothetical protein [Microlunatus sp.]